MSIDANAVARGLAIETRYQDSRSASSGFLPQRIAVIAQGASDAVYATTKFQATSGAMAGERTGYGGPAHLVLKQLLPSNGDGVGSIPVTVYPLEDAASGVAAEGSVTPSGTQTSAAAYKVRINNTDSEQFVIPAGANSVSDVCARIGESINAVLQMPVKATYTYGTVASAAGTNAGNGTLTALSATGSPVPGNLKLECITAVADGGVFKLTDPLGTVITEALAMTPGPAGATVMGAGGLAFTLTDGTTDFAVGDWFEITVPATDVKLTAKWKGESSNALYVEILGDSLGTTFTIVQPSGGLVNPSIDGALAQIGNVWETLVINALNISDTAALDALKAVGEGRRGPLVKKPFVAFTGNTAATVAAATAVSSTRRSDAINSQLVSPGSRDLPFVVAARQVARIAVVAANNPPMDYGAQQCTGLTPGSDAQQWNYVERDQAVKAGSSTVEPVDGVVQIGDVVTFYRPTGEDPPAYRYVVDEIRLMNLTYRMEQAFGGPEWASAPLIPDNQPTVNRTAKKPKLCIARANAVLQACGDDAILSDVETSKKLTTAVINAGNPKRLDIKTYVQVSGNTNLKDIEQIWSFFFGTPAIVA